MKKLIFLSIISCCLYAENLKISVAPVNNEVYKKECGSCHFAYPAGLLPSNAWNKMMENLSNHFGDDASVDEETFRTLSKYLNDNSAEKNMNFKRSKKIVESLAPNEIPDAISTMPYIKRKHKEIRKDLITQKEVKGLFNCTACHKNAQKGVFSDEDVNIPNYGKWDKK